MFCPILLLMIAILPQGEISERDFDAARTPGLNASQIAEGWLALFDGQSTYGWRGSQETNWQIAGGALTSNSKERKTELLRTAAQFDNFQLKFDFAVSDKAKSSLLIRTSPKPVDRKQDCFEIQLTPQGKDFPTGSISSHDATAKVAPVAVGNDKWNQLEIHADGLAIKVWLNDVEVVYFQAKNQFVKKGFIGLSSERGATRIRNIVIKPQVTEQMIGEDLEEWVSKDSRDSKFDVEQEVLNMTSGPGQLETRKQYDNFIFSSHIRTNADGLNSGIFFRCIPGDFMNGYESQIQNQFKDNDRSQPSDCGTGGIFRRQNARSVNATDKGWFAKTIIADGATICVWVNGLQVADWTDKRKANLNPRRGRRLEAGTIILQGHDPTTDVSFRAMKIRNLEKRR